jgi:hypothetical protein
LADAWNTTTTQGRISISNSTQSGRIAMHRRSASDFEAYRNAGTLATISTAGGLVPTIELYLLGLNNNGTLNAFPDTIKFAQVLHEGFTDSDETADYNAEATFLTALGR